VFDGGRRERLAFYLFWPQPWKGNTSNGHRTPGLSGQTLFGFRHKNMARYPERSVLDGKDPVCVGHRGAHSWDFTGQHISA